MGPYLALFKQRLENQWPLATRITSPNEDIAPNDDGSIKVCNLLVAICRTTIDSTPLHERRNFGALTFGNCLRECYRQGLLPPVAADIPSQAEMIVKTLNLIDIVSRSSTFWTSNLVSSMSSESLMNTRISSIFCEGRKIAETRIEPPQQKLSYLIAPENEDMGQIVRDLNISILTSIGGIKIIWTSTVTDHLKLYLAPNDNRLKIYWFGDTAQKLAIYGFVIRPKYSLCFTLC